MAKIDLKFAKIDRATAAMIDHDKKREAPKKKKATPKKKG